MFTFLKKKKKEKWKSYQKITQSEIKDVYWQKKNGQGSLKSENHAHKQG